MTRKILFAALATALVVAAIAGVDRYRSEQQRKDAEVTLILLEGMNLYERDQFQLALETLRSIPEDNVYDYRVPYFQGRSLIQLKDYEAAVKVLEQAHGMNDQVEGIPFALGVAYFKLGKLSLSKSYFHAVLKINPYNEEAKGLMDAMASLERAQPGDARSGAAKEIEGVPKVHPRLPATSSAATEESGEGS